MCVWYWVLLYYLNQASSHDYVLKTVPAHYKSFNQD
jgi:hypothetical protein